MHSNIDLRETIEYKDYGFKIVKCPVCMNDTLDNHFICLHCGWEYDGVINESVYSSANKTTIDAYRMNIKN